MATPVAFLPAWFREMIQINYLTSELRDPLVPRCLWRQGIPRKPWQAREGEEKIETRSGVIDPVFAASSPRTDPTPKDVRVEQFRICAENLHDAIELDFRQNYHVVWPEVQRQLRAMATQAGTSVGRWSRRAIFSRYGGGHTWLTAQALVGAGTLTVARIAGFTHAFTSAGRLDPVSATNPLSITVGAETLSVIGATPAAAAKPLGAGTLTLAAVTTALHAMNSAVLSSIRPRLIRVGGGTTSRALAAGNLLTLAHIDQAVARMRILGVPAFPDGRYRAHISPEGVRQLRQDTAFQNLVQGVPESMRVTGFEVGDYGSCIFVENPEAPSYYNVHANEDFPGAVTSAETGSVNVGRALLMGADTVEEHFVPEMEFPTVPAADKSHVQGMLGQFVDRGNYVEGLIEGIRIIFRAPQDQKGERCTVTWSWTGDFAVPTDYRSQVQDGSGYKRAVIIEHADLS